VILVALRSTLREEQAVQDFVQLHQLRGDSIPAAALAARTPS
jgi:hypothetical protein